MRPEVTVLLLLLVGIQLVICYPRPGHKRHRRQEVMLRLGSIQGNPALEVQKRLSRHRRFIFGNSGTLCQECDDTSQDVLRRCTATLSSTKLFPYCKITMTFRDDRWYKKSEGFTDGYACEELTQVTLNNPDCQQREGPHLDNTVCTFCCQVDQPNVPRKCSDGDPFETFEHFDLTPAPVVSTVASTTTSTTTIATTTTTLPTTTMTSTTPTTPTSTVTSQPTTTSTSSVTTQPTTTPTSSVTTQPKTTPTSSVTTQPTTTSTSSVTTQPTTPTSSVTTKPTTTPTSSATTQSTTAFSTTTLSTSPTSQPPSLTPSFTDEPSTSLSSNFTVTDNSSASLPTSPGLMTEASTHTATVPEAVTASHVPATHHVPAVSKLPSIITTTTTTTTTTGPQAYTRPPTDLQCMVCSGRGPCELFPIQKACKPPNHYCINHIINKNDGDRIVNRTCGNFDTCYHEWFEATSDNDRCQNFDEDFITTLNFECTYCCVTDLCNKRLHPPRDTLYKDFV